MFGHLFLQSPGDERTNGDGITLATDVKAEDGRHTPLADGVRSDYSHKSGSHIHIYIYISVLRAFKCPRPYLDPDRTSGLLHGRPSEAARMKQNEPQESTSLGADTHMFATREVDPQ